MSAVSAEENITVVDGTDSTSDYIELESDQGYIENNICDKDKLNEFAKIPSREGLYTMLAGGMIQIVKDLSIALNLYAEQKDGE